MKKILAALLVVIVVCTMPFVLTGCSSSTQTPEEIYDAKLAKVRINPNSVEAIELLEEKIENLMKKEGIEYKKLFVSPAIKHIIEAEITVVVLTETKVIEYPLTSSYNEVIKSLARGTTLVVNDVFIRNHQRTHSPEEECIISRLELWPYDLVDVMDVKYDPLYDQFELE